MHDIMFVEDVRRVRDCAIKYLGGHFNCSKSDNCNEIVVDILDCESRFFLFSFICFC